MRKKQEDDDSPGAPEWMVTFSDCMTLLLTFFVLLLSFSSFDDKIFRKLKVIFAEALPGVSLETRRDKEAFRANYVIQHEREVEKGSEKPTLAKEIEGNLKEDTESENFHDRKVFLISSNKVFWGRGTVISLKGRKTLSAMAAFLKEVPNRVVISENSQKKQSDDNHFGLKRAWAVIEYLTTKQGLDRKQFSISTASNVIQEKNPPVEKTERMLEIILLERSIYN